MYRTVLCSLAALFLAAPGLARPQATNPNLGTVVKPVQIAPKALVFPATRAGDVSAAQTIDVTNAAANPVLIEATALFGDHAGDFVVQPSAALPALLAPSASLQLDVVFQPTAPGPREAKLGLAQTPHPHQRPLVGLSGTAIGALGADLLVNVGGPDYAATSGETWLEDYGFTTPGTLRRLPGIAIQGTPDPDLYGSARAGQTLHWEWELPDGSYAVTLHFAELLLGAPGARVFDVILEGATVRKNLDVFALAGLKTAHQETEVVAVADGRLDLDLVASSAEALLSAVEVRAIGQIAATPAAVDLGVVPVGQVAFEDILLENVGLNALHATTLTLTVLSGEGTDFSVELNGMIYNGAPGNVMHGIDLPLDAGQSTTARVWFAPGGHAYHDLQVELAGDFPTLVLPVIGGAGIGGDPYLHPVIAVEPLTIDFDLDGSASVHLDGTGSHTHEPGHVLTSWEWRENAAPVASGEDVWVDFPVGPHTIELEILDDNVPPRQLATTEDFLVAPVDAVPGVLTLYHEPGSGQTPDSLLDAPPLNAEWAEVRPGLEVVEENGVGGSGYLGGVMVRALATLDVASPGTYDFAAIGGYDTRLLLDGATVAGPLALAAGPHTFEARWAVASTLELPLDVLSDIGGQGLVPIEPALLTHDQRSVPPVINSMPTEGINLGGNQIVIDGFGFFPDDQVVVHWGNVDYLLADFTSWSPERIELVSPPGSGLIDVSVETPSGTSNVHTFEYKLNGPVPIVFNAGPTAGVSQPTCAEWAPDGRLFVASRDGTLHALTFADDWTLQSAAVYGGVSTLSNREILGIAFDPYAPRGTARAYVAHCQTYAQGGSTFSGPAPYTGAISRLDGPGFDQPVEVVTGLPTSNHDHGVNGMVVDDNGDLLVCVGGNTNAGVKHPNMGDLPESPLSGAIIKVEVSRPDFMGALSYVETATGVVNMDQVFGEQVDLAPGTHVSVHAAGIRNPYDLTLTTWGMVYATDNGPNSTFGVPSNGPTSQLPFHASDVDELLLVEYGHYYGHPNRNRGRQVDIENYWFDTAAAPVPGFTQVIATLPSSSDGIVEYTAATFGEALRGNLLAMKFEGQLSRVELSPDKRSVTAVTTLSPWTRGLDVVTGPGGALVSIDYMKSQVRTFVPQDVAAIGLTVYDVQPWRAPAGGGQAFVVGGSGFGTLADTSVTIAGQPATLTSVSPTRIRGVLPPSATGAATGLVNLSVTVGAVSQTLAGAFRYMPPAAGGLTGQWTSGPAMPLPLGEVAAAAIDGKLYVVGEGSTKTLTYDFATQGWTDTLAVRPFIGHHNAAEVYQGKWYLVGGLGAGQGKVQIYDPVGDVWSLGANMPWAGGSVSSCLIGGKIYAAGGIVGNTTVDSCAVYDIAADSWTPLAPMPAGKGRNHAAADTDGQLFWVFGGRGLGSGAGNFVANGYADVHVYDPATNTWSASYQPGSGLSPLPIGRGGTGKAVFYKGEFYVFGGETLNGPGAVAGNVYDRVDVYDPTTDTWRLETPMPTPRHGIFPVRWQGRLYLPGGGVVAGFSSSSVLDSFHRP